MSVTEEIRAGKWPAGQPDKRLFGTASEKAGIRRKKNYFLKALALGLLIAGVVGIFSGCSGGGIDPFGKTEEPEPIPEGPAPDPIVLLPEASGERKEENEQAVIDYSHAEDGYVMVRYTAETDKALKVQVKSSDASYTYDIVPGEWNAFPLSTGDGAYTVQCCENIEASRYAVVLSVQVDVTLSDEFAPFLRPNQYVDYAVAENTLKMASQLLRGRDTVLARVKSIYDYVVGNLAYDYEKAAVVSKGYLPVLDEVLAAGKGICFDYAALMTGMLRSQGIPCKLVVGYAGEAYHAWISVWSEEDGWIEDIIYFDGKNWVRMDPTFASTGSNDPTIHQYIGDGNNYMPKYFY